MRLANLRQNVNETLSGEAVPQLNIKGNTFTLITPDGNSKVVTQIDDKGRMYVDVHFVDANTTTSKTYYKEKYSNKEELQVAPTCFSEDSIAPSNQSQEKQAPLCSQCEWNVWGTAIGDEGSGKGKRCRDMWKTAVIVPSFSPELIWQMRVPPASLKNWKAYMGQFAEFEVQGREGHVGDVITRMYFEPGEQGKLNFEPTAMASPAQQKQLQHIVENDLAAYLIGLASAPPALPKPAAQKQLAAPKPTADAVKEYAAREAAVLAEAKQAAIAKLAAMQEQADASSDQKEDEPQEDEVSKLKRMLAQAEAAQAKPAVQAKTASVAGMAKAASSVGQPKATLAPKPKGAIALDPGMRTKTGTVIPPATTGKPAMSKFTAAMAKHDAVEAETVEEQVEVPAETNALAGLTKKQVQTPSGIPQTQLPSELQALLAGVLGK